MSRNFFTAETNRGGAQPSCCSCCCCCRLRFFGGRNHFLASLSCLGLEGSRKIFFSRLRFLGWERFLDISLPFLLLQTWKLMRGTYFGLPRMRKRDEYPTKPSLSRGAFLVTRDEGRSHPRLRGRKKMKPFSAKKISGVEGGRVQKTTSNKRLGRKISIAQFSLFLAVAVVAAGGNEKLCCSSLGFCIFHFSSPLPRRHRAPKKSSLPLSLSLTKHHFMNSPSGRRRSRKIYRPLPPVVPSPDRGLFCPLSSSRLITFVHANPGQSHIEQGGRERGSESKRNGQRRKNGADVWYFFTYGVADQLHHKLHGFNLSIRPL